MTVSQDCFLGVCWIITLCMHNSDFDPDAPVECEKQRKERLRKLEMKSGEMYADW